MKALIILALMLGLEAPGKSPHSTIVDGNTTRPETYSEAVLRWHGIAQAIEKQADGDELLARAIVTTAWHESNFRRDVHSGAKRGDGGWSHCLMQIQLRGKGEKTPHQGYVAADLVGLDEDSTSRCIEVGGAHLKYGIKRCGRNDPRCLWVVYSGGWYHRNRTAIVKRAKTLARTAMLSHELPAAAKKALGIE